MSLESLDFFVISPLCLSEKFRVSQSQKKFGSVSYQNMILCKDLNSFPSSPACTSLFLGTRVFLIYVTTRASFKKKTLLKIETRTNCWKRTGWNNWLSRVTVHNPSRDVNAFLHGGILVTQGIPT